MDAFTLIILRGEMSTAVLREKFLGTDKPVLLTTHGEWSLDHLGNNISGASAKILCLPRSEEIPSFSASEWKNIGSYALYGYHEELCLSLSETCKWAFFPWPGYWDRWFYAFLTHSSEQADKLIALCAPEMVVSRYDNITTPENVCQGIVWSEDSTDIYTSAKLAWRLGELEQNPPILICDSYSDRGFDLEIKARREYEIPLLYWPEKPTKGVQILYQTADKDDFCNFWDPNQYGEDGTPVNYVTSGLAEVPNIQRNATTLQNLGTRCGWAFTRIYYGGGESESYDMFWARDPLLSKTVSDWLAEEEKMNTARRVGCF
jgi:hypothetical protein